MYKSQNYAQSQHNFAPLYDDVTATFKNSVLNWQHLLTQRIAVSIQIHVYCSPIITIENCQHLLTPSIQGNTSAWYIEALAQVFLQEPGSIHRAAVMTWQHQLAIIYWTGRDSGPLRDIINVFRLGKSLPHQWLVATMDLFIRGDACESVMPMKVSRNRKS